MEVNFMIRDNNSTSQHNTKCLHDMLRSKWLLKETDEIVKRGGIWAYVGRRWLKEEFLLMFHHYQGIIYHSSFLQNKMEQIIKLQYLERTVESCPSTLDAEKMIAPILIILSCLWKEPGKYFWKAFGAWPLAQAQNSFFSFHLAETYCFSFPFLSILPLVFLLYLLCGVRNGNSLFSLFFQSFFILF